MLSGWKGNMKELSGLLKVMLVAETFLSLSSVDAWARPPRAREVCGVVERINRKDNELTVVDEKRGASLNVAIKPDTQFIHNGKFANSDELMEGMRVCVFYRSPLIGKPFVTKVVWPNGKRNHERR